MHREGQVENGWEAPYFKGGLATQDKCQCWEKASGITCQVEASCFQGPGKQLKCMERVEVSYGEW